VVRPRDASHDRDGRHRLRRDRYLVDGSSRAPPVAQSNQNHRAGSPDDHIADHHYISHHHIADYNYIYIADHHYIADYHYVADQHEPANHNGRPHHPANEHRASDRDDTQHDKANPRWCWHHQHSGDASTDTADAERRAADEGSAFQWRRLERTLAIGCPSARFRGDAFRAPAVLDVPRAGTPPGRVWSAVVWCKAAADKAASYTGGGSFATGGIGESLIWAPPR
jgi:hypothetical protein